MQMGVNPTALNEIVTMFHSMFKSPIEISPALEQQYFRAALGEYALNIRELPYDASSESFERTLTYSEILTLALMMYTRYLTQELSRVLKLNGIGGKDVTMTGVPASKTQTAGELQHELEYVQRLLYKQMRHCYA